MRKKLALGAAAAVAAIVLPVSAAGTAHAAGEFHVSGVYQTGAQCSAAGTAGQSLWGPNWFCNYSGGYYYLMTH